MSVINSRGGATTSTTSGKLPRYLVASSETFTIAENELNLSVDTIIVEGVLDCAGIVQVITI